MLAVVDGQPPQSSTPTHAAVAARGRRSRRRRGSDRLRQLHATRSSRSIAPPAALARSRSCSRPAAPPKPTKAARHRSWIRGPGRGAPGGRAVVCVGRAARRAQRLGVRRTGRRCLGARGRAVLDHARCVAAQLRAGRGGRAAGGLDRGEARRLRRDASAPGPLTRQRAVRDRARLPRRLPPTRPGARHTRCACAAQRPATRAGVASDAVPAGAIDRSLAAGQVADAAAAARRARVSSCTLDLGPTGAAVRFDCSSPTAPATRAAAARSGARARDQASAAHVQGRARSRFGMDTRRAIARSPGW